jgi:HEAT repeat protein
MTTTVAFHRFRPAPIWEGGSVAKRTKILTIQQSQRQRKISTRALLSQLTSKSSFVRAQAAERIGLVGDPREIPSLEQRLTDRSPEVRMRVVEALGKLTNGRHAALATALQDADELVRLQGAESIAARAARGTVSALRVALRDDSPLVRSYAAAALGRAGTRADRALLRTRLRREASDAARLGFFEGLWLLGDRTVLGSAIGLLDSHDYRVRCATARALGGTFRNLQTQNAIITALRDRLRRERTNAVRQALVDSLRTDQKN